MIIQLQKDASIADLINQMQYYFPLHSEQASQIAEMFAGPNCFQTALNVWQFLRSLKYKADKKKQVIKTPYRLMKTKTGDCKSYSIFAASVLYALGYSVRFVYTCNNPNQLWHVHVQVECGGELINVDGTVSSWNQFPTAKNEFYSNWMQLP